MTDLKERVKARTDLLDLVRNYVPDIKQNGKEWVGLCPFHGEKTPSFTVSPEKQMYYCFGCQAGGDVFNFVQEIEGVSFAEALDKLRYQAGEPLGYAEIATLARGSGLQPRKPAESGASAGQSNTASNVGTNDVGIFKQKTGVDLEFKRLDGVGPILVTDDTGNSEVDIGLAATSITAAYLANDAVTADIIAADAVGASEIGTGAVSSSELASTSVIAGSYETWAGSLTVDADGRLTDVSNSAKWASIIIPAGSFDTFGTGGA